ncbi:MAG: small ribosomal subunit Rsm22 family protein [Treponemataceae bacterium]|nr:small ribosomal subunit Rsm22 family protein [Treponemataceae bacterium]
MKNCLFEKIPDESWKILNEFDSLLQDIKPLNSKQLAQLPENIRELSHLLTDDRSSRRMGYMNSTVFLAAYTRYFMWWNLVRLTPVFSGFSVDENIRALFSAFTDDSVLLDIGSGPLTVPVALWLASPELRKKKLTFYCLDYSQTALAFGEEILLSVAAKTSLSTPDQKLWQIVRVKGAMGTSIKRKADMVFCANMFNELFWDTPQPLEQVSKKYCSQLLPYLKEKSSVFVVEPGVPRAARFVSLLRDSLMRKSFMPLAPCPHADICPMDGRKGGKWCHFTLLTDDAPARLMKLSAAAGIPKDRASLSFIFSSSTLDTGGRGEPSDSMAARRKGSKPESDIEKLQLRVVSDSIRLNDGSSGRYACCEKGLALAIAPEKAFSSGDLIMADIPSGKAARLPVDKKSGAIKITLAQ